VESGKNIENSHESFIENQTNYLLDDDIGERNDMANTRPEKVAELASILSIISDNPAPKWQSINDQEKRFPSPIRYRTNDSRRYVSILKSPSPSPIDSANSNAPLMTPNFSWLCASEPAVNVQPHSFINP
jgi:hypothetical protein